MNEGRKQETYTIRNIQRDEAASTGLCDWKH